MMHNKKNGIRCILYLLCMQNMLSPMATRAVGRLENLEGEGEVGLCKGKVLLLFLPRTGDTCPQAPMRLSIMHICCQEV